MKSPCQSPLPSRGRLINLIACLLCIALFTSACTTTQRLSTVAPTFDPSSAVRPGDTVKCTLKDGAELVFKVKAVTPAEIRGETEKVDVTEITRLEVKRFSPLKTTALSAGVFTLVFLTATAAALGALAGAAP